MQIPTVYFVTAFAKRKMSQFDSALRLYAEGLNGKQFRKFADKKYTLKA
jgi:hypothetical protein